MTPETEELVDKVWITHGQIAHNAALADAFLYEAFHHYAGCKREMSRAIFFTVDAVAGHMALVSRAAAGRRQAAWPVTTSILAGALTHQNCYPS